MQKKVVLVALSLVAVLSIVGAVSAQEAPPPAPDIQAQVPPRPPRPGQDGGRLGQGAPVLRELLQIVADELALEPRALADLLRDQTLAEVITAQNGDAAAITAAVEAALTERIHQAVTDGSLTQERANLLLGNLEETVTNAINGAYRDLRDGLRGGDRPGQGGLRGGWLGETRPLINAAADATGLTPLEIGQAVRGGQTLGEVITANGGDSAAVVSAAVATVTEKLDEAVSNGRITEEQERAMIGGLQAFYEAVLNGALRPDAAPGGDGAAV